MPHSSSQHSLEEEKIPFIIPPKILLITVIGMGVLIILGIAVLIGVIVHRLNTPHRAHHTALSSLTSDACFPTDSQKNTSSSLVIPLKPEEHIAHITPVGTCVLALHIIAPHYEKIFLWDLPQRRIIMGATFSIVPSYPTPIVTPPSK